MKKLLIFNLLLIVFAFFLPSCSKDSIIEPIVINDYQKSDTLFASLSIAREIAENINKSNIVVKSSNLPVLKFSNYSQKRKIKNDLTITDKYKKDPYFYVFNYESGGFVIISANKRLAPIVGYSENGDFNIESLPLGLIQWLESTASFEKHLRTSNIQPSEYVKYQWNNLQNSQADLKNAPPDEPPTDTYVTVGPFLSTKWEQNTGYNTYCPVLSGGPNGHALTGCSVTAMAQVMAYWRYPSSYNWNSMGIHSSDETARLMGDIFPHVITSYDTGGSSCSNDYNIRNTLRNNFNYHANLAGWINGWVENGGYNYQTVVSNLNNSRPVILGAYDSNVNILNIYSYPPGSGHTWVCDGYKESTIGGCTFLLFHMNWGWGGTYNGWFAFDNWSNANGDYNHFADMIYDIYPNL